MSIITVSLNSEKYIADTIKSVKNQTYPHKEHIIIDGASTDSTVNIISQYEDDIAYWVSEPDNGIANAMNKGIEQAKGDYLLFLNSDDYLLNNDVLGQVVKKIDSSIDINIFKVLFLYP
ncbi:MAG: glycosyltransferase, partial [Endozoicomonadaceae bacterium]|nr:glycosyltransferase [Endozoicomonadaceae bacterium]